MKKSKGITLIALVITIIILIILAGVAINLGIGDNGIFNKAKLAKEKYNEESIREKVELGIMELEIDELTLGNQITIESALQELLEKGTFETIDKDVAIGNIGEYEVKLKYNEQGKVVIEYIEKAIGVRVTYKLNPESYTNREKVGILLTVNGKVKSVTKPDNLIIYPENNTVAINYQVTANGIYKFIIEDEEGNKQEKNVVVDTIDRLPPNDFTITGTTFGREIKVIANATDAESDGISVKSGIDRYEYFVKLSTESYYTKYESNPIKELTRGNYLVYVIAYDKAGNSKKSNTIEVEVQYSLGSYVDYGIDLNDDGDTTNDWMIFYEEDGTVNPNYTGATYIIPAYYVPCSKMQKSIENAGMMFTENINNKYGVSFPYENVIGKPISEDVKNIFMYDYSNISTIKEKCVSRLLDTLAWEEEFVTKQLKEKGGLAIGGPTINMWAASWNKENIKDTKIEVSLSGNNYWLGSRYKALNTDEGYKTAPNIYFCTKTSDQVSQYLLASGMSGSEGTMINVTYQGILGGVQYHYQYALRPLVYLPSSIKLIKDTENDYLYRINYGE